MGEAILVGVQIRVLGPLEVDCGHQAVAVSRRQERALLVLLALQAGRPVSVDRLIDLRWDRDPPSGAREAVQTYVSRLRRVLSRAEEATTTRLVWRSGAYILDVDPICVDALRFELLVGQARRIDQPVERAAVLSEALGLWRGAPLIDVISDDVRNRLAAPLEYLRADAFDLRIRAEPAAGRHEEVLAELISAVQDDPLNERLVNSLIQALHRTGRSDQALSEFHRLRQGLVESAGRDPGPEITATHLAVLRPTHPTDDAPSARPTPAQLPPDVAPFVGRVARGDIPYSVSAQSALYRSLLARRRTLIILDNRPRRRASPSAATRYGCEYGRRHQPGRPFRPDHQ